MTNKTINKKAFLVFLFLLLAFFSFLILSNEYTLFFGEDVFLVTQPVDPRDLLRGDYVILSYQIENEPEIQEFITENNLKIGDTFYIILKKIYDNYGILESISLENSKNQLALRATVSRRSPWNDLYAVDLGIGKYFVPEGRGLEVERITDGLHVLVAIDRKGIAKIKDLYYKGEKIDLKPIKK